MLRALLIGVIGLFLLNGVTLAADQPKTFEQILKLKELGFSDDEVKATAEKSGTVLNLTDTQARQLKEAGAGDGLIRALRPKITAAQVVQMSRDKKPLEQIVDAIVGSGSKPIVTVEEAVKLADEGVDAPTLILLKGKPLGVNELKALAKAKVSEAGCRKMIEYLDMQPRTVEADDALALADAGLSKELVALVRKRADEAAKAEKQRLAALAEVEGREKDKDVKHPKQFIGDWDGTMGSGNFIQQVRMSFTAAGRYTLTAGAGHMQVRQAGTWFVANGVVTFEVDNGRSESHQFDIDGDRLKIRSGGGSIDLRRMK